MATVNLSSIITPANVLTASNAETLTNKTIAFGSNTLTGVQPTLVSGTSIKTINSTSLLGSGDIAIGGLAAATQAEMEAATSNTVAATPLNTNSHPGVAKVWIKCDAAGGILGSYNVTSITDVAIGKVAVTIATDFSSTNYVIVATSAAGANDCFISVDGSGTGGVDPTAGSFRGVNRNPVANDPAAYMFACFGDQ